MSIDLALVGAGNIAGAHAAALDALAAADGDRVRLVAVVDPRLEAAETLAAPRGARAFGSVESMLAGLPAAPDAAVVCTPPSARMGPTRSLLGAGCSVLLEKPLAHTIEDGEALVRLADAHPGAVAVTGFCHRFTPAVERMIDLVAEGRVGRVVRSENTFAADLPHLRDHWMSDARVAGGGSLIDTGLHSLDLFTYLFGPSTVAGAVFRHGWVGRAESNATVLLRAAGGPAAADADSDSEAGPAAGGGGGGRGRIGQDGPVAGVVACGWAENSRFDLRLIGTAGSLFYDFEDAETLVLTTPGGVEKLAVETHEVRFERQLGAFVDRVAGGVVGTPLCPVAGGLDALRLVAEAASLDLASRSAAPAAAAVAPAEVRMGPGIDGGVLARVGR